MTFNQYQSQAKTTYKKADSNSKTEEISRLVLGICGESGEVAEKMKKFLRGDYDFEVLKGHLQKEMGDVLWYLAMVCEVLEIDFETVAQQNLDKLKKRLEKGTIQGNGDER
jgi:NTP pyrophosphatase (non-canonical NTP hydrolase)